MDNYLDNYKNHKVLPPEEQLDLCKKAQEGCEESRSKLILHNMLAVLKTAKKYTGHGIGLEDLVQEGAFGLNRAIDKFKFTKNVRFITYAMYWIWQAVQRAVVDKAKPIRYPTHFYDRLRKYRRLFTELEGDDELIQEMMELSDEQYKAVKTLDYTYISSDQYNEVRDGGKEVKFKDMFIDHQNIAPEELIAENEIIKKLQSAVMRLPNRMQLCISHTFGLFGCAPKTYRDIADIIGTSYQSVSQTVKAAKNRLSKDPDARDALAIITT